MAVQNGHDATVRLLLDRGANLEAPNNEDNTALHLEALKGYDAMIYLLLDHGANLDATTNEANTALHLAVMKGMRQPSDYCSTVVPTSRPPTTKATGTPLGGAKRAY